MKLEDVDAVQIMYECGKLVENVKRVALRKDENLTGFDILEMRSHLEDFLIYFYVVLKEICDIDKKYEIDQSVLYQLCCPCFCTPPNLDAISIARPRPRTVAGLPGRHLNNGN